MSKICHYLRHIDLKAVYEQLQDYTPSWDFESPLANIQLLFRDNLAEYFDGIAEAVFDDLFGKGWEEFRPVDVAIEVGDFIENSLDELATKYAFEAGRFKEDPDEDTDADADADAGFLPRPDESVREALDTFWNMTLTKTYDSADYWQLSGLLIYQYDYLCWLYEKGAFSEAFEMFEFIARTRCKIQNIISVGFDKKYSSAAASQRAKKAATQRHAPSNEIKAKLLAEWDKDSGEYKSRADFCRVVGRISGIKERTLGEWIAKHEKSK
ncbi:hypothetical protein ACQZ2G_03965 [Pseudomonas viridiflava]|uniref:hypothetical protein n=1 Tax=Pseudomonas viridiflava TaxID=33069 RepID=UPI003D291D80